MQRDKHIRNIGVYSALTFALFSFLFGLFGPAGVFLATALGWALLNPVRRP